MIASKKLEFLKETAIKFGAQGSPTFCSNADLFEYLHDAVAELDWAQTAIRQAAAAETA